MILIIQSQWNESVTSKIASAAADFLKSKGKQTEIVKVPGALEIPLAAKWAWSKAQREQSKLEAIIACGAIVKGDTYHFEIVANESARELMRLSTELRLPIGNAILAVYQIEQAIDRAGGKMGNKGIEAAEAVLQMIELKEKMGY